MNREGHYQRLGPIERRLFEFIHAIVYFLKHLNILFYCLMNEWLFTGLNHNIVGNTSSSCHFFIIIICIIIIINSQFIHPIVFHRDSPHVNSASSFYRLRSPISVHVAFSRLRDLHSASSSPFIIFSFSANNVPLTTPPTRRMVVVVWICNVVVLAVLL